jgi:hypothetical protein
MDHVNFDNQDRHTSRTPALLLHSEESQDCYQSSLVYQLLEAIFFAVRCTFIVANFAVL